MESTLQVAFAGRLFNVKGVKWNTSVKEIITKVLNMKEVNNGKAPRFWKQYLLLEDWRGCVRVLRRGDKVMKVLDGWGLAVDNEEIPVRLKLIRQSEHFKRSKHPRGKKYRGSRVAARKRMTLPTKTKGRYIKDIVQLCQKLNDIQKSITKLTTPIKPKKMELSLPINVTTLPPELEDECIALQEEYEEERKENAALLRRKDELSSNILSQKTDSETLTESISTLEARVLNEQHKLNRVIETSGPPELKEAQKEVNKLQSELKVRTKLNQLQSAKLRELTTAIENTEQEILEITKKLQTR